MKKKSRNIVVLIIFILVGTNIATLIYYNFRIQHKNNQVTQAYSVVVDQNAELQKLKDQYNELQQSYEQLNNNEIKLKEKNDALLLTYQKLVANYSLQERKSKDLEQRMNQLINEYGYVFNYDPVTLEECKTYIGELEDRIMEQGGFDIYETPRRWKDYDECTIWLEDGSNEKWADEAMTYVRYVPKKMMQELNDNGWMIIITPRDLDKVYGSKVKYAIGMTFYYRSRIYIQNSKSSIQYSTIHEIAHAVDFMNNFLSNGDEWEEIYKEEAKKSGLDKYYVDSQTEYFAETFQNCMIYGDEVRTKTPKTYEYMMKLFDSYK